MFFKRRRAKKDAQKRVAADAAWESKRTEADLTSDLFERIKPYEGADLADGVLDKRYEGWQRPLRGPRRD
jgi:hypothetical protein